MTTPRVRAADAASGPPAVSTGFDISRYQSNTSDQANEYMSEKASDRRWASDSSSNRAATSPSRASIHRSIGPGDSG